MGNKYRATEETQAAKLERYKQLAQPALVTAAVGKLIAAGRQAAIDAFGALEADEREACEKAWGKKVNDALAAGAWVRQGGGDAQEGLYLFVESKKPAKKKKK